MYRKALKETNSNDIPSNLNLFSDNPQNTIPNNEIISS